MLPAGEMPPRTLVLTSIRNFTVEIAQETDQHVSIVSLKGRLDASTASSLDDVLSALVGSKATQVLVDCRELDYISSAGLRSLLSAAKQFKKISGQISLCSLSPNVKQVFEISGFTSIFPIHAARDEALQSLKA